MSVADTSGGASTPTSGALPPGFEVVKNTHSNDLPTVYAGYASLVEKRVT